MSADSTNPALTCSGHLTGGPDVDKTVGGSSAPGAGREGETHYGTGCGEPNTVGSFAHWDVAGGAGILMSDEEWIKTGSDMIYPPTTTNGHLGPEGPEVVGKHVAGPPSKHALVTNTEVESAIVKDWMKTVSQPRHNSANHVPKIQKVFAPTSKNTHTSPPQLTNSQTRLCQ